MTSNRFVKGQPSATISEPVRQQLPTSCEIPGCKSLFVGTSASGIELFKTGKADVFVDDERGNKRGVCCRCYATIVDHAGVGRFSDLVGFLGCVDPTKLRAYWDAMAQRDLDVATRRAHTGSQA